MRTPGFERTGSCERCGWFGGLDDRLCIVCANDPATFSEPATVPASVAFEMAKQCASCGREHQIRTSDLCPRCAGEAAVA